LLIDSWLIQAATFEFYIKIYTSSFFNHANIQQPTYNNNSKFVKKLKFLKKYFLGVSVSVSLPWMSKF
jgi:hypothetical protein